MQCFHLSMLSFHGFCPFSPSSDHPVAPKLLQWLPPLEIWLLGLPGCPVVRTWCFHCQGPGSIPGQGIKILQDMQHGQKNQTKKYVNPKLNQFPGKVGSFLCLGFVIYKMGAIETHNPLLSNPKPPKLCKQNVFEFSTNSLG